MEGIDVLGDWLDAALTHPTMVGFPTRPGFLPIPLPTCPGDAVLFLLGRPQGPGDADGPWSFKERARERGLHNVEILESARVSGVTYDWENHFGTISQNFKKRVAAASCL